MFRFFGGLIGTLFALGLALLPVLFAAWAFSKTFRVKEYLKLLMQINNELQRLNDYNEGKQK